MAKDTVLKMSAFVDCNSESIVLRVPYALAVAMLKDCAASTDKTELIAKVKVAATRSRKLSALLDAAMIGKDDTDANGRSPDTNHVDGRSVGADQNRLP